MAKSEQDGWPWKVLARGCEEWPRGAGREGDGPVAGGFAKGMKERLLCGFFFYSLTIWARAMRVLFLSWASLRLRSTMESRGAGGGQGRADWDCGLSWYL